VLLRVTDHPRARPNRPYVFEHILVMEKQLGRRLEPMRRSITATASRTTIGPRTSSSGSVPSRPGSEPRTQSHGQPNSSNASATRWSRPGRNT